MAVAWVAPVILWMAVRVSRAAPGNVVFGTWNILSVSKCDTTLNGFPNMEPDAFNTHNGVKCEAESGGIIKAKKVYESMPPLTPKADVNLEGCESTWVAGAVRDLMDKNKVDVLVLQEIDYHMYLGLDHLTKETYGIVPLSGMSWKEFGVDLKKKLQKSLDSKIPAGDAPVVVYNTQTIVSGTCDAPKSKSEEHKKMNGKVALCQFEHMTNGWLNVVGMHAPGDKGFNAGIAAEFHRLLDAKYEMKHNTIHAVLGDFNLGTAEEVNPGLQKLSKFLTLPPDMTDDTVLRHIHVARKLFQLYQNYWQDLLEKEAPFQCNKNEEDWGAFFKEFPPTADQEKLQGEIEDMKQFCADWEEIKAQTETPIKKPPGGGKLAGELVEIRAMSLKKKGFAAAMLDSDFDWREFPKALGSTPGLDATKEAMALVNPEVKREDYVAYNGGKYDLVAATTHGSKIFETEEAKKNTQMPVAAWPSDHLPITMELKPTYEIKNDKLGMKKETWCQKIWKLIESRKGQTQDHVNKKKKALIRSKLGDMAPTMAKLSKALKHMLLKKSKGTRSA